MKERVEARHKVLPCGGWTLTYNILYVHRTNLRENIPKSLNNKRTMAHICVNIKCYFCFNRICLFFSYVNQCSMLFCTQSSCLWHFVFASIARNAFTIKLIKPNLQISNHFLFFCSETVRVCVYGDGNAVIYRSLSRVICKMGCVSMGLF